jgi:hypothetical protein
LKGSSRRKWMRPTGKNNARGKPHSGNSAHESKKRPWGQANHSRTGW